MCVFFLVLVSQCRCSVCYHSRSHVRMLRFVYREKENPRCGRLDPACAAVVLLLIMYSAGFYFFLLSDYPTVRGVHILLGHANAKCSLGRGAHQPGHGVRPGRQEKGKFQQTRASTARVYNGFGPTRCFLGLKTDPSAVKSKISSKIETIAVSG